mgnify:CR=1 FL=1
MSKRHNIKKLYKPIQPTVANDNRVSYAEVNSSPLLSNYIFCYWQLQTLDKLNENFTYQVVSDGCIDIFWEVDKPQLNFITGFSNQYTEFPLSNHFNYFGIRFLPTSFPALFNINAAELTNRFEVLDTVISSLAKDIYPLDVNFVKAAQEAGYSYTEDFNGAADKHEGDAEYHAFFFAKQQVGQNRHHQHPDESGHRGFRQQHDHQEECEQRNQIGIYPLL